MKNLFFFVILILLYSCGETSQDSVIGKQFSDPKEMAVLEDYEKVSDTTFFNQERETEYSLLHLKKTKNDIVVFSKIMSAPNETRTYKVLDTLNIESINSGRVTIGYCELDKKKQSAGNIIALVEKVDNQEMFNQNIRAAWRANYSTEKIEKLESLNEIKCFNQWYDGENRSIEHSNSEES